MKVVTLATKRSGASSTICPQDAPAPKLVSVRGLRSAMVTGLAGFWLLERRGWVTPLGGPLRLARTGVRPRHLYGGLLFGVGWAFDDLPCARTGHGCGRWRAGAGRHGRPRRRHSGRRPRRAHPAPAAQPAVVSASTSYS